MADFPALIPSQAPITYGNWPMAGHQSMDGKRGNVRTGSLEIGRTWTPIFENIIEADYLTILAHYRAHRLRFDRFAFTTATLAAALTPTGYAWRWAEPPQVVDRHADVFVIRCAFECVPRPLVSMRGGQWRSAASTFTRGAFAGVFGAFETGGRWASAASTFTRGAFSGGLGVFELGGQWGSAQTTFTRGAFSGTSGIFESGAQWVSAATTFVRGRIAGASVFEAGAQWASEATTFTRGAFAGSVSIFNNVQLLLPFGGSNGSTTFTDASAAARTITPVGQSQISTAQSKWGGSSGLFDGSGDYLDVTVTGGLGSSAFTIEFWFYQNTSSGMMFNSRSGGSSSGDDGIDIFADGRVSTASLWIFGDSPVGSIQNTTWTHFAVTRDASNVMRRFLDGTQVGPNTTVANNMSGTAMQIGGSSQFNIGSTNGYIDDFRITVDLALYTSNFTVPSGPFPTS